MLYMSYTQAYVFCTYIDLIFFNNLKTNMKHVITYFK